MSIRNLIPPRAWELLKSKDPKIAKELSSINYLVVCDTCEMIFFETSLDVVRKEISEGLWDKPRKWYVTAGRHWITAHPNCLHEINFYVIYPSGTKVKGKIRGTERGLSEDWLKRLGDPDDPNFGASKESMLNELQYLEDQFNL